jgi:hypothetical protein
MKRKTHFSYAQLCVFIEQEIAPTCDLLSADRQWLIGYIDSRLRMLGVTKDAGVIEQAIVDTAEELRQREQRERRLTTARAAAEETERK